MLKEITKDYITSTNPNASFEISTGSDSNYYQLKQPYQITYEFCSGTKESDYMNAITFSEDESFYARDSFYGHDKAFHDHPLHFHDYYEIMVVLSGTVTQRIEDIDYKYPEGTCCLINRGIRHSENFDTEASILFVGLSTSMIGELFTVAEHSSFHSEKDFMKSDLYNFIISDLDNPERKAYLDMIPAFNSISNLGKLREITIEMLNTMMFPHFGSSYKMRSLLSELLFFISSNYNYHCTEIEMGMGNDQLLFSRIGHLMDERNGRISRAELEKALNYSGDYLNRIVNKFTGMCLYDYGMTFCLKKAANELVTTKASITSIAQSLQFSNRTHFYSLFEKQYHMTPKEYRAKNSVHMASHSFKCE